MRRRLTTESFIQEAKAVHGDRYDYSQVNYTRALDKIIIICPKHGPFQQIARNHLRGTGCSECSGHAPLDTNRFIDRARKIHGGRYDYSLVRYKKSSEQVTIICPVHGEFKQIAGHHLKGHGCAKCRDDEKRKSTSQFINEASKVHGDKYDYSHVEYHLGSEKVKIVCPEHGAFMQTPNGHLAGNGCMKCAGIEQGTTESFIKKAKAIHGERYDYSLVNYKNNYTPVTIICSEHGHFVQTPSRHLESTVGCAKCAIASRVVSRRLTNHQFITKARAVHGERYDYSLVDYITTKNKVKIICPEHGEFLQKPDIHLRGSQCPVCAGVRSNTVKFIKQAKSTHGNRYDYSLVHYHNSATNVRIICPKHGEFDQIPSGHLAGRGCPGCAMEDRIVSLRKWTRVEDFIEAAREVHGDRYDYSEVEYKDTSTEVKIRCREHGIFKQSPYNHLKGHGCRACVGRLKKSTEQFITEARKMHGDYYDYSLAEYESAHKKVLIICPEHGITEQRARDHLRSQPYCCAKTGFDYEKPAVFYYIKVRREGDRPIYKVGITNKSVSERFMERDLDLIEVLETIQFEIGRDAYELEQTYLKEFAYYSYDGPNILSSGNTELFTHDVLGLDTKNS